MESFARAPHPDPSTAMVAALKWATNLSQEPKESSIALRSVPSALLFSLPGLMFSQNMVWNQCPAPWKAISRSQCLIVSKLPVSRDSLSLAMAVLSPLT